MKPNIGQIDQRIRLSAGGLLLLASLIWTFFLAAILGVYGLLTGLIGWCPVYQIFGLDTLTPKREEIVVPPSDDEEKGTEPEENG